jgi:hypothetical protein
VDDVERGGLVGTWVRRAEVDALLDEIGRLTGGDAVPVPLNERQAELMAKLGIAWLQEHAPHRLKATSDDALDAAFFEVLERCDAQEPLKVYDSNSWRRIGLANRYKEVVYPEQQRPDGHLNISNTGVLRALVAAFNAMLARRLAPKSEDAKS